MTKLPRNLVLLVLCNIFLLSSCCKEEDIVYARININGEQYEDFETKNCLYTPSGPMIFNCSECKDQLYYLPLLLRSKTSKNYVYSLYVYFEAPLTKLKTDEYYNIVPTADSLLFSDKILEFDQKIWQERKELPTFGNGGVSILLTGDSKGYVTDITSLSGTCIIYDVDSKGIANGYLKLSGVSTSSKTYHVEGSFTAYLGNNNYY